MSITIENFETFLFVLVRITGFMFSAPFFSVRNSPARVRIGLSLFIAILLFYSTSYENVVYTGVIEYSILIVKEAIVGLIMGLFANLAYYILSFVGQMIDSEIGLSMSNILDPISNTQVTITANFYSYMIMIIMLITNLHHQFIKALTDSFVVIPLGQAIIRTDMYKLMINFIIDFFLIGFRIILPVFATTLIVNVILGILARVAPQMNMFVVGLQIKIIAGLVILLLMVSLLPAISDFIFNEMIGKLKEVIVMMKT